jgi:hypothetical protein
MSITIEQKYEAAQKLLNAQVDALVAVSNGQVELVVGMASLTRGLLKNWITANPDNQAAYDALGADLMAAVNAEIAEAEAAAENAEKQGYPNV